MNEFIEKYSKEKNITSKYSLASMKSNLRRVEKIIDKNFDDWEVDDFKDHENISSIL